MTDRVNGTRLSTAALWLVLAVALALRLHLATSTGYIHDEDQTAIPLSKTISFTPGALHLPLRGENHGALPAYVVRASSALFDRSPLGYRGLHIALGLATIVWVTWIARQWFGTTAAVWTAALLAFNEYYLTISARSTAHVPHLLLVTAALWAFARFLATNRAGYLYAAGTATGLAFYVKEHAALLLPVFFLSLMRPAYRHWLRRPAPYVAAGLVALLLLPDLVWNARTNLDVDRVAYADRAVRQANYASHLRRVGGLGLSPYPSMFYGYSAVQATSRATTGAELTNHTPEYQAMNVAVGALLVVGVLWASRTGVLGPGLGPHLLLAFWFVFGFFTLIRRGESVGRLDPVSWIWVESTLVPAVLIAGHALASSRGAIRVVTWSWAALALLWAILEPLTGLGRRTLSTLIDARDAVNHAGQVVAITMVDLVRLRPLWYTGVAIAAGLAVGVLVGFACGWWARGGRRPIEHELKQDGR